MAGVDQLGMKDGARSQKRVLPLLFDMSDFQLVVRMDECHDVVQRRNVRNERLHVLDVVGAFRIASWMRSQHAVVGGKEHVRVEHHARAGHGDGLGFPQLVREQMPPVFDRLVGLLHLIKEERVSSTNRDAGVSGLCSWNVDPGFG